MMPERPTLLRVLLLLDLLLVTLIFGLGFAHVMERAGRLQLNGAVWLSVRAN